MSTAHRKIIAISELHTILHFACSTQLLILPLNKWSWLLVWLAMNPSSLFRAIMIGLRQSRAPAYLCFLISLPHWVSPSPSTIKMLCVSLTRQTVLGHQPHQNLKPMKWLRERKINPQGSQWWCVNTRHQEHPRSCDREWCRHIRPHSKRASWLQHHSYSSRTLGVYTTLDGFSLLCMLP